ncbi:hypothetical protein, partial [Nocardia sp. SC052]|uniref:hypothetical protein n=1 Tax=Nocardia sichangensis TaxID=3385975 RepID=UPI0039A0FBA1
MSDTTYGPAVEDEMIAQARQFSAAMRTAMHRHAQAANWIERRRVRKEISRLVRTERRQQQQARAHHRIWTSQAVDRYRLHAQAVAQRANDPRVDHDRRARDARALVEHRDRLAVQFIGNEHLTRTEQGIALDGLDAATVFPEYKTGNLFARAHKVKGLEALHYRARVARETVGARQRAERERENWLVDPNRLREMGDGDIAHLSDGQARWGRIAQDRDTERGSRPVPQVSVKDAPWAHVQAVQQLRAAQLA